jgi:hypothetical protein
MEKYAQRNLSVVWGLTNENGRVVSLEITVDRSNYSGERFTERAFSDIARVFNSSAVDINAALDFSASALAALTTQCFCDQLNDDGYHEASLGLARESRRQLELALERLDDGFNAEARAIAQYQRRRLLPCVIRQEALALGAGDDDRALDRLHEALPKAKIGNVLQFM